MKSITCDNGYGIEGVMYAASKSVGKADLEKQQQQFF